MAATWSVVDQRQIDDLTPAGFFIPAWEVTAQVVGTPTLVTVRIPEHSYTPENVAKALDALVATVVNVSGL